MKITSTYSVRLRNFNRVFDDTVEGSSSKTPVPKPN